MNRKQLLADDEATLGLFNNLQELHNQLAAGFKEQFNRAIPFSEELIDRWARGESLGFGKGTGIYDSSFVFGDVKVGEDTWIGPFTIIDGSGGLEIGNNCTISAGVHIYTHDNVFQTLTGGKQTIQRSRVTIGNCTYIAPNVIIRKGLSIGNHCVVATGSFVNTDIPSYSIAAGTPAKVIGTVIIESDKVTFQYNK